MTKIKIKTLPPRSQDASADDKALDQVTCPECFDICKNELKLKKHMRKVHGKKLKLKKPFKCGYCRKKFAKLAKLKVHEEGHQVTQGIVTHEDERPFKCQHAGCPKSFKDKDGLRSHQAVHTNERPYECPTCGTKFKHRDSLKTHMKIHTEEKQFQCTICSQTFRRKDHLKDHVRIHTGEKPFECRFCERKFGWKKGLKHHEKIAHAESLIKEALTSTRDGADQEAGSSSEDDEGDEEDEDVAIDSSEEEQVKAGGSKGGCKGGGVFQF